MQFTKMRQTSRIPRTEGCGRSDVCFPRSTHGKSDLCSPLRRAMLSADGQEFKKEPLEKWLVDMNPYLNSPQIPCLAPKNILNFGSRTISNA